MVVGLLIIYTTISGVIGYRATSDSLYDQYTEDAFQVANAAAFVVDGDELDEMVRGGEDSELYRETWNRLDQLCNAFDATFVPSFFLPSVGKVNTRHMSSVMSEPQPTTSIN